MKLRRTKTGVSLQFSLLEWDAFKKLIARIWYKYSFAAYPNLYTILEQLICIPEIEKVVATFTDKENGSTRHL